jgi:hypothetical protein
LRYTGDGNRGIFAAIDIKKGEEVLFIPKKFLITKEQIESTPLGKLMKEREVEESTQRGPHNKMSAFVL